MFVRITSSLGLVNLALMALQDGLFGRIWSYLTYQFTFGRITVSASSLAIGLLVAVLTLSMARLSATILSRRLLNRGNIDPGLRYTITRLVRYLVITVGLLIALKQAFAVDLTSIAVVFTALSVGIGFGLQYIAADIASGFILLFERPVRVGDRVTIGEDEGDVQSINLRTTTVFTNNRIAIIVPNSKLVSQRVVNWSYGDPTARIPIPVSVADDSSVELVTRTLIEAARGVENVLADPEPRVQFLKFGNSSFDFRLLVWSGNPRRHVQIKSDINYRIEQLFRERGIKLPSLKQEILLRRAQQPADAEGDLLSEERASDYPPPKAE